MSLARLVRIEAGAVNVVTLALTLPLILYLGYSGVMSAQLADVKVTVETAARAAARDYAGGATAGDARRLAYEVVGGSLPVGSGRYDQTVDCRVGEITVNGTRYTRARVDYRYPVLVPDLPELLGGRGMGGTVRVWGTADFAAGT